ncbi:MAG: DUF4382 domain-containing protein, partial [Deltaproteobacteria bacterium]|nr:DUF4382 domain-containing protein [Deltaproteobacteria bacterium]
PPVVIYQSTDGVEVDLLALRDEDYLLKIHQNVPAGLYSKIRLRVSNIDVSRDPCDQMEIKLPSGRIDLNPRGPFEVAPGGTVSIRLDIDANKSINLHEAGNSDRCIFRPVVFVDIEEGAITQCPRILSGKIESLIVNDQTRTVGFVLALGGDRGMITVRLLTGTDIFDEYGEFVDASSLRVGQKVKVRGKLSGEGFLEASVVVIGDVVVVGGEANGSVEASSDLFAFTAAPGEELLGQYDVRVVEDKTLILIGCDTMIGTEAIQAGVPMQVIGKVYSLGLVTELQAVAIVFKVKTVSGVVTNVRTATGGRTISVRQKDDTSADVFIPTGVPIYLEGDGILPIDPLCINRQVRILLEPDPVTPPTARLVYVEGERHEGIVEAADVSGRTLVIGGQTVIVPDGAVILSTQGSEQVPIDIGDIKTGNFVIYFGLQACPPATGFYAQFILLPG